MKKPYFILLSSIAILAFYFIFYKWNDETFTQTERLTPKFLPRKFNSNYSVVDTSLSLAVIQLEQRDVLERTVTETLNITNENGRRMETVSDRLKVSYTRGKVILFYTRYLGSITWPRISETSQLKEIDGTACNAGPCSVTYNKNKMNESDAVVFHEPFLPTPEILQKLRKHVSSKQIWIWNLREPPYHLTQHSLSYMNIFNWTCTYSPKSEVYDPIFHIIPTEDNEPEFESSKLVGYNNSNTNKTHDRFNKDFASKKSKMVFTAINNCLKSRLELLRELKKYVSIDVYGRCGKHVGDSQLPKCKRFSKSCSSIMNKYKFSFSMENSYCDYYVTEKYYQNGLQYGLVPIVLGGAVYNDPMVALNHSFIDIENFENLQSLGTYLNYLNTNDTAYNEYFWWRTKYKVTRRSKACAICKRLWKNEVGDTGQDIEKFWNVKNSCKKWSVVLKKYLQKK